MAAARQRLEWLRQQRIRAANEEKKRAAARARDARMRRLVIAVLAVFGLLVTLLAGSIEGARIEFCRKRKAASVGADREGANWDRTRTRRRIL